MNPNPSPPFGTLITDCSGTFVWHGQAAAGPPLDRYARNADLRRRVLPMPHNRDLTTAPLVWHP
ncbi:MAG: hypothetical protein OXN89_21855, partial [Bryobacterales bacterium]|nr:hypothetical protein [Bryobacterales bacterium]